MTSEKSIIYITICKITSCIKNIFYTLGMLTTITAHIDRGHPQTNGLCLTLYAGVMIKTSLVQYNERKHECRRTAERTIFPGTIYSGAAGNHSQHCLFYRTCPPILGNSSCVIQ